MSFPSSAVAPRVAPRTAISHTQSMNSDLEKLAAELGAVLAARGRMLVTAESCTGGWVSMAVTAVEGSSAWFERGFVTYHNAAKREMLGVGADVLSREGAVSEATVRAMVRGALEHSHGDVALAVSGIAGPGGGSAEKPVGTVWFAWRTRAGSERARKALFQGDRGAIRAQAVAAALAGVIEILGED